jgi:hypothetical protein
MCFQLAMIFHAIRSVTISGREMIHGTVYRSPQEYTISEHLEQNEIYITLTEKLFI